MKGLSWWMLTKFRHIQLNHSKSLQAPLLVHEGRAVPAGHNSYPCKDVQNSQMGYNLKESVVFQWLSLQETDSDIGMQRLPPSDKAFPPLHVCYFRAHPCSQWQEWEQSCTKPGSDACRRDVVGEQLSTRDEQLLASWIQDACWTSLCQPKIGTCALPTQWWLRSVIYTHFTS